MENQLAHNLDSTRTDDVRLKDVAPFSNWLLNSNVKKGLQDAGFKMPTVIQASAIPIGKTGLDLLIQSKAGTGKTLIFCTILLENCFEVTGLTSITIAPTREVALQIENVLRRIARPCKNFQIVCAIGGTDMSVLRKQLQTANAVVGTPGRLVHLIESDIIKTSGVKLVILDEADQLYGESHRKNVEIILNAVPVKRQILACSATFCNDLDMDLAKIMRNPLLISTKDKIAILIGIKQYVYKLPDRKGSLLEMEAKVEALLDIFKRIPFKLCMVFACSQSRAETYASYLKKSDWQCELISGALPQSNRNEIFQKFCNFETRILVSTDLMARGIDSQNVNLVINLEPPRDMVTYLHRIGRAGRFGSFGIAINILCTEKDNEQFKKIISEMGSNLNIHEFPMPNAEGEAENFWEPLTFKEETLEETHILRLQENKNYIPNTNNSSIEHCNNVKILCNTEDSQLSINTNTFCVDSKDSAVNILNSPLPENKDNFLLCQPEDTPTSNRSSVQLSANTIDDASSIAADSQFSVHQDLLAPCSSLVMDIQTKCTISELKEEEELAIKNNSKSKADFFLDYDTYMLQDTDKTYNETKTIEKGESAGKIKKIYDPFADYIQYEKSGEKEETASNIPESNDTTTIGEDFTNEKQDTSMQVCVHTHMPTELETFGTIHSKENIEIQRSASDAHLTDSQTFLDQTNGFTTNDSCNADSEPSMDMSNPKGDSRQNLSSAYFFDENVPRKTDTDDDGVHSKEIKAHSKHDFANEKYNKEPAEQKVDEDGYERKEVQTIDEIWINEYWKQVNFIESYTKFMLDYNKKL